MTTPHPRSAVLLGATGLVGRHCLDFLLASDFYASVAVLARRPVGREHPKLHQHTVRFDRAEDWSGLVRGDDVYCCLGTTIRKAGSQAAFRRVDFHYPVEAARAAAASGAEQFLLVSALGADARSSVFYNQVKGEVEEALAAVGFPALHIFRPSLLLGERAEFRFGERVAQVASRALPFVFAGPLRKYLPVEARDVARAMVTVALAREGGKHAYESDEIQRIADRAPR